MAKQQDLENMLQCIQKNYISLPPHEERRNNEILNKVINQIIAEMKNDAFFKQHYNRIFYGGSYFDNLRVGKPDEFDLDILLKLPKLAEPELSTHSNEPGYLHLRFLKPQELSDAFKKMVDGGNYLSTAKVRAWMESLVTKTMNKFRTPTGDIIFNLPDGTRLKGTLYKAGPAMNLLLKELGGSLEISVDLVPCFEFGSDKWPKGGYRPNPVTTKSTFFIVPKSPKNQHPPDRYWRLSFQEQERELMNGMRTLKPTLKLFKLLRDKLGHKAIASYYIKTIFLWENEKNGAAYWNDSLTNTFFKMLVKYIEYFDKKEIPYFWNKKNNILGHLSNIELQNIVGRLRSVQQTVQGNPAKLCDYLGTVECDPRTENALQTNLNDQGVSDWSWWGVGAVAVLGAAAAAAAIYGSYASSNRNDDDDDDDEDDDNVSHR